MVVLLLLFVGGDGGYAVSTAGTRSVAGMSVRVSLHSWPQAWVVRSSVVVVLMEVVIAVCALSSLLFDGGDGGCAVSMAGTRSIAGMSVRVPFHGWRQAWVVCGSSVVVVIGDSGLDVVVAGL